MAVRLAVPWNELIANGFFDALFGAAYVAPLVWLWFWVERTFEAPHAAVVRDMQALRPKAEDVNRTADQINRRLTELKSRAEAMSDPISVGDPAAQALIRDLRTLEADVETLGASRDAVVADMHRLEEGIDELDRRLPRLIRAAIRVSDHLPKWGIVRWLGRWLSPILLIAFYVLVFPWWGAVVGFVGSFTLPGLVRGAVRTREWSRIIVLVSAFAVLSAISNGLTPVATRTVQVESTETAWAGRYLLLGRTEGLVFLRPCDKPAEFFSLPWSQIVRLTYEPIPTPDSRARSSIAQVIADAVAGVRPPVGQDTVSCSRLGAQPSGLATFENVRWTSHRPAL